MATNPPIELYFVHPIYARGEHIVGENALTESGAVNMVRIARGQVARVHFDAAKDLIIAKQAIDNKNAKPSEKEEAHAFVEECKRRDAAQAKKVEEGRENETSLKNEIAQLREEVKLLRKKAA